MNCAYYNKGGFFMNIRELNEVSRVYSKKEKRGKHMFMAFMSGGVLSLCGQFLMFFYETNLDMSSKNASTLMIVTAVFLGSFLTGIGVYDSLAQKLGAGLFVPITGFSNALTSCAMEGKSEGLIYGIGANMFKLAGSVITYGIVAAYVLGMIRFLVFGS